MRLRTARAGDVEVLLAIERAIAKAPHWSAAQYQEAISGLPGTSVRRVVLIAEVVGQPEMAGFAAGSCASGGAELESVAVRPEARRRGVGEALCRGVAAWAVVQGAEELRLEVRAGSAEAIRLYERVGMRRVGIRRRYYREPTEDAVLMSMVVGRAPVLNHE